MYIQASPPVVCLISSNKMNFKLEVIEFPGYLPVTPGSNMELKCVASRNHVPGRGQKVWTYGSESPVLWT